MGRPSKLTPNIEEIIIECISLGLSYEKTAAAAGITRQTLRNYVKRGQKAKSGKYFIFFNRLRKAEAEGERINFQKIRDAAVGGQEVTHTKEIFCGNKIVKQVSTTQQSAPDWRAAAWILERRYPERYGRCRINDKSYHPAYGDRDIFVLAEILSNMPKFEIERLKLMIKNSKTQINMD